ncbi:MAG TPA: hypothetical protein VKB38_00995 [Terracidiphilus sp.]|nr:hypothetical protein [Terracidiphilus sp.]
MRLPLLIVRLGLVCGTAAVAGQAPPAPEPSAAEIMMRVAANQDQAEAARTHYIYVQHAKMASRKGEQVMCEEVTDYRISPSSGGEHEELMKLDGRLRVKGKYATYNTLAPVGEKNKWDKDVKGKDGKEKSAQDKDAQDKDAKDGAAKGKDADENGDSDAIAITIGDEEMDRELVENLRRDLMHNKSKDGINAHLFPLTTKEQGDYTFELAGRERLNGRDVYHIRFRPKDKNEFAWNGNAYVDAAAFQPVLVTTEMSRKIPFAVRTMLGTNVPGLGFTVVYAPQADGVWFPASFSSEFKIHVLYFFHREILMNAENRDFEKTHVSSRILEGMTPVEPQKP